MAGQIVREVEPVQLDVDEVHGERELVAVKGPVPIDVGQAPDLGQDGVWEPGLDHLLLGHGARDPPLGGAQRQEDLVPLPPLLGHDPLRLPGTEVNA